MFNADSSMSTPAMSLDYEGKRPEREILQSRPAPIKTLWQEGIGKDGVQASNRLYYGDNLPILASLLQEPAICGKVQLIYIDPPFATNSVFQSRAQGDAYHDLLVGSHYIEYLRERLIVLRT
jgi:adenine-specific DNA-methyltransferase